MQYVEGFAGESESASSLCKSPPRPADVLIIMPPPSRSQQHQSPPQISPAGKGQTPKGLTIWKHFTNTGKFQTSCLSARWEKNKFAEGV